MSWLSENWIWVLVAIAFVALHLFGHSGHGGHGSHRHGRDDRGAGSRETDDRSDAHRHGP